MKGLGLPLRFEQIKKSWVPWLNRYRLTQLMVYVTKGRVVIEVPVGFITNFATWIKPRGKYDEATVVHDYLYSEEGQKLYGFTRKQADKIFKEMMERGGCSRARIHIMYYGVRLFGWTAY